LVLQATNSIRRVASEMKKKHVQSLRPDGLDRQEIAGERRRRVLAEK
jgi:hypothetical protein